jgi:predicted nucleic acid-binding protein
MILLDTNVLSDLMRPAPTASVVSWVSSQPATMLYTTSITKAEILYGLLRLPAGRRREKLASAAAAMFDEDFQGRILPFGGEAAVHYAAIAADRYRAGRPISAFDAQIAAIARAAGADVATRNIDDYAGCGIRIIDPWQFRGR